jgi:hypothetical protein
MAGMRVSRFALLAGAWVTALLTAWAAFAFFNTLLLVPANPALTDRQNYAWKIGGAVLCAVAAYLFFRLSKLAFRKANAGAAK